jgi:hypothetical protein
MRSTVLVLLFCVGLLTVGCDEKPKPPGAPMPKAMAMASEAAVLVR